MHTCSITQTSSSFKAELLVGNYTASADAAYKKDANGYNYGQVSGDSPAFVVTFGKVITPV